MNKELVTTIAMLILLFSTTLGSALVFFFKRNFSSRLSSIIVGLSSGIMLSVSIFGLLIPAMDDAKIFYDNLAFLPVIIGFVLGAVLLYVLDKIIPHLHKIDDDTTEGIRTNKIRKNTKFFFAVTMHNIPEGIAVGLAIAMMFKHPGDTTIMMSCLSLAIAIGIQNFPEGAATSIPMLENGNSKFKSFMYGFISGIVEPLFAGLTILIASFVPEQILPWLLAFAAGAMIYVTVEELIPDIKQEKESHFGMWSFIIGFLIMMLLELLL